MHKSLKKSDSHLMARDKKKINKDTCFFCPLQMPFSNNHFLYRQLIDKYNASQNFFYSKDINDFLFNEVTPFVILVKDYRILDLKQERIKNYFNRFIYKRQISQLTQYYRYYKDLPRIHMKDINKILKKHHQSKRLIEYNKLRVILNLVGNPKQQNVSPKQVIKTKNDNFLSAVNFSNQITQKQKKSNESQSVIQLKQKLAAIIQNDRHSKILNLQKLDNQYSFEKIRPNNNLSKTRYFDDESEITENKMKPDDKCFMKKKVFKETLSTMNSNPNIKKKIIKNDRKRLSMENIKTLYIKQQRSVENELKKLKRRSQDNLFKPLKKNQENHTKQIQKQVKFGLEKQLKDFLSSTDTSYQKLKLKFITSPNSDAKKNKFHKEAIKHNRVVSQQFQIIPHNFENIKKEKFKITINQNNIFNFVLEQKLKKSVPKGMKKFTKK